MRRRLVCLLLLLAACGAPPVPAPAPGAAGARVAAQPSSPEAVLAAMHDRYADSWYQTLRFRQRVLQTRPDGTAAPEQVWLEHMRVPGALRIDMAADYSGNAVLFAGDSTFVLRDGAVTRRSAGGNILLVLGFDVYRQPVARTVERLRAEGFDLGVLHTDTWQGRPTHVIGAPAGDSTSAQFWVDAQRLVFVRLIEPRPQGGVAETRFDEYRQLAGGWISPLVIFFRDGKESGREVYFDIEANPVLPEGLLDPARWHEVRPR